MGSFNTYLSPFLEQLNQGAQVAQHLLSAAQQQKQLDFEKQAQQQRADLANREFSANQQLQLMSALQNGARTVDSNGNVLSPPSSTATGSTPTPSPSATSATAAAPPDSAANVGPGFGYGGELLNSLQSGGASSPSTPIPMAPPSSTPPPAATPAATAAAGPTTPLQSAMQPGDPSMQVQIGGKTVQVPGLQDQLARATALKEAQLDASRVPITKEGADLIGNIFPVGTKVDPAHMPGLASLARAKAAADANKDNGKVIQQTYPSVDDSGKRSLTIVYTDGSVEEKPLNAKGKSDKFDPANAAAGATNAQTRALTENQRQTSHDRALKQYQEAQNDENDVGARLDAINHALKLGGAYTVDKNGYMVRVKADTNGEKDDPQVVVQNLTQQRDQLANQLGTAIVRKYDSGDEASNLSTGKGAAWNMSKADAVNNAYKRAYGQPAPPDWAKRFVGGTGQPQQQPAAAAAPAPSAPAKKTPAPAAGGQTKAQAPAPAANDATVTVQLPNGKYLSGPRSKIDAYLQTKGMRLTGQ